MKELWDDMGLWLGEKGEHSTRGGGEGAYISLSRLTCCGWAQPRSAVHFSPAASRRAVQSWPVCCWITWANECTPSSPYALNIQLTLLPESPHLSTPAWPWGAVIKR